MSKKPKPLVAGNWKMNGLKANAVEVVKLMAFMKSAGAACDILICPPYTLLAKYSVLFDTSGLILGAQDCHPEASGAHTGDVSAEMLKDAGCEFVIVGHSERRADYGETDELIARKAAAAQAAGLVTIICVGETEDARNQDRTLKVVSEQLAQCIPDMADPAKTVIAYEPVWAIGTGRTPTADDVSEVHAMVRAKLNEKFGRPGQGVRILYGGSVKPANAKELMAVNNVNGALVGGASLKADDLNGIIDAYR